MNRPRDVLRLPADVSYDQAGSSWLLAGYAILVAIAIYCMCVA
jgi:hypothetical protein